MTVTFLTQPKFTLLTGLRKALLAMVALNSDPADREAQHAFQMSLDGARLRQMADEWSQTEDGRWLLEHRPLLNASNLSQSQLLALPQGTLAHALGQFYLTGGFGPFPPGPTRATPEEYVALRIAETHDLWHTVTGYGGDPIGELELHAFMLPSLALRTTWVVVVSSFVLALKTHSVRTTFRRMRAAYQRGRTVSFDTTRWERLMTLPLERVRQELGFASQDPKPRPPGTPH